MQNISSDTTLWRLFLSGGPLMWPILLCSIFSMAIVVQKLLYFSRISLDVHVLRDRIFEALRQSDIKGALELCDRQEAPVTQVLKAGLLKLDGPKDELIAEMEGVAQFAVAGLEDQLAVLAAIGQVTPLLGFLGTASGLATAFYTVHARSVAMNPLASSDIAGGLWQALISTIAAFMVTIPTVIAYHFLIDRRNRYVLQMERLAAELVGFAAHLRADVSKE